MLLGHSVKIKKRKEMWFILNSIPIRYSLMEHALIGGLNCSPYPLNAKGIGSKRFWDGNFLVIRKVSLKEVKEKFEKMHSAPEKDRSGKSRRGNKERSMCIKDKLKMAVLYLFSLVLMNHDKESTHVRDDLLEIINNLEGCHNYPWRTRSYAYLMDHVQNLEIINRSNNHFNKKKEAKLSLPRFVTPLMLLPFECIPSLSPAFTKIRHVTESVPRMCRWSILYKKKMAPTLPIILEVVGETKDIQSIIVPTT